MRWYGTARHRRRPSPASAAEFSDAECVELLLTASFYCCVSRTLLSFGITAGTAPPEDDRNEVYERLTSDRDR